MLRITTCAVLALGMMLAGPQLQETEAQYRRYTRPQFYRHHVRPYRPAPRHYHRYRVPPRRFHYGPPVRRHVGPGIGFYYRF